MLRYGSNSGGGASHTMRDFVRQVIQRGTIDIPELCILQSKRVATSVSDAAHIANQHNDA
jgi:hypothetical protein